MLVVSRTAPQIEVGQAQAFLEGVIAQHGSYQSDAQRLARDVLDDIAETGFVAYEGDKVHFVHRAFLEHFALRGLTRFSSEPRDIARLASALITSGIDPARLADALGNWPRLVTEYEALWREMGAIKLAAKARRPAWRELRSRLSSVAEAQRLRQAGLAELFGD